MSANFMKFENYRIRLVKESDFQLYFEMIQKNRSRLERFFAGTVSRTQNLEDTRIFLMDMKKGIENNTYFAYVLVDDNSGSMMGFIDLKNIDWTVPKSEIGFFIDGDYAGQGITSKALAVFCQYCFEHHGFKKIFLRTHESNMAAIKVAEKCGFEIEGVLRRDYKTTAGELVDVLYYGKLDDVAPAS